MVAKTILFFIVAAFLCGMILRSQTLIEEIYGFVRHFIS